ALRDREGVGVVERYRDLGDARFERAAGLGDAGRAGLGVGQAGVDARQLVASARGTLLLELFHFDGERCLVSAGCGDGGLRGVALLAVAVGVDVVQALLGTQLPQTEGRRRQRILRDAVAIEAARTLAGGRVLLVQARDVGEHLLFR